MIYGGFYIKLFAYIEVVNNENWQFYPFLHRFLTVSTLGGCGGPERTDFLTLSTLDRCGGLERTDL